MIEAKDAIEEAALAYYVTPRRSPMGLLRGFLHPTSRSSARTTSPCTWPGTQICRTILLDTYNLSAAANRLMQAFNFSGVHEDEFAPTGPHTTD